MIDASSKLPSGLLAGNFFDLGHFDECYAIKNQEIYGKYCLGTYSLPISNPGGEGFALNITQSDLVCNF